MDENTRIHYMYRDASNYKFRGSVVVTGRLRREDLQAFLIDNEWFVPERVGFKHLLTEPMNSDDHLLHEIEEFEATDQTSMELTSSALIKKFADANDEGWYNGLSGHGYSNPRY